MRAVVCVKERNLLGAHEIESRGCALNRESPRAFCEYVIDFTHQDGVSPSAGEMEWPRAVEVSQEWTKGNGGEFKLASTHEESRRIDLASPRGSFYVTVPEKPGTEWVLCLSSTAAPSLSIPVQMVWSEDESCVQRLSESLEYMAQPRRTLNEVSTTTYCYCSPQCVIIPL